MILDLIILLLKGILDVFIALLTPIDIAIDFISSIPIVVQFLQVVAYVLPWSNLLPIFILVISIFLFRIMLAWIKLIWHFIPIVR